MDGLIIQKVCKELKIPKMNRSSKKQRENEPGREEDTHQTHKHTPHRNTHKNKLYWIGKHEMKKDRSFVLLHGETSGQKDKFPFGHACKCILVHVCLSKSHEC